MGVVARYSVSEELPANTRLHGVTSKKTSLNLHHLMTFSYIGVRTYRQ